jgi:hypothetical protein
MNIERTPSGNNLTVRRTSALVISPFMIVSRALCDQVANQTGNQDSQIQLPGPGFDLR